MAIPRKVETKTVAVTVRFPADVIEGVDEYARLLCGETDRTYVIVESCRQQLKRDAKEIEALRAERRTAGGSPGASSSAPGRGPDPATLPAG